MKRVIVTVAVLCAAVFVGLRVLERVMTFRPIGYDKGTNWTPPDGVREEWVRSNDGTLLHTWLFPAKGTPRGFILYSHGNGGNLLRVATIATNFADRGYNVMLWDYRGYGRSGGSLAFDEATLFGDADAVYRHLRSKAGKPIIVWGHSLGTTVSADLCSRNECAALILESGLSSANEFARTQVWFVPRFLHGVAHFRFASAERLRQVHCPVLIAHGTSDFTISFHHGEQLFSAANEPKKMLRIDGGTHWLASSPLFFDGVSEFLKESVTVPQPVRE